MKTDRTTGWLWVASFLGIAAFPPSVLFISEFMIVKTMFIKNHNVLCALFLLLLTIVLYGIGKAVIRMAFSSNKEENEQNILKDKFSWTMYAPQIVMLMIAFILGIYMPTDWTAFFLGAVEGF